MKLGKNPMASMATSACESCRQEADHRIANHLTLLSSFVRLQGVALAKQHERPSTEAILLLLEGIRGQIEAVAHLHRALIFEPGGATDLDQRLHDLCGPLVSMLSARITLLEDFAAGCQVGQDQILPLTQIVSEAITNAVKYGCPRDRTGTILVRSRRSGADRLSVEVIDEGPGLPDGLNVLAGGGFGFQLMRSLGAQLGADIELNSSHQGLSLKVLLPFVAGSPQA